jgi:Fe-S oxidoreductase
MSLAEYKHDMLRCTRCSYCKWIPWENFRKTDFIKGCPSVSRYHWHAYSAGGKFNIALSFLEGRIQYSDTFLEAVYRCQMDGSCDVSCKSVQDIEPLQLMQELRIKCVGTVRRSPPTPPLSTAFIKRIIWRGNQGPGGGSGLKDSMSRTSPGRRRRLCIMPAASILLQKHCGRWPEAGSPC